jgi:hypothetical protein
MKSEIREPKFEGNPKGEGRRLSCCKLGGARFGFRSSDFGFLSAFGFRVSGFAIAA